MNTKMGKPRQYLLTEDIAKKLAKINSVEDALNQYIKEEKELIEKLVTAFKEELSALREEIKELTNIVQSSFDGAKTQWKSE